MGSGQMTDRDFFDHQSKTNRTTNATLVANAETVFQTIPISQLDTIFQRSQNLDPEALFCFIESLCKVSKQELADQTNPRKFSLQCLVEVADLNMDRIRFVWQKIW